MRDADATALSVWLRAHLRLLPVPRVLACVLLSADIGTCGCLRRWASLGVYCICVVVLLCLVQAVALRLWFDIRDSMGVLCSVWVGLVV